MTKRTVEISEWALPLKYAGYFLLIPLIAATFDLLLAWRAGDAPHGLIAWVVLVLTAAAICEYCGRRLERGQPVGFEVIGGMVFGCFGIAIALVGFTFAEEMAELVGVAAFGMAFIGIGCVLIFVLDPHVNKFTGWGDDPDITINRRRLKPMVKRGLIGIGVVFVAMLATMETDDAILLAILLLVPVFILLLIYAVVKH